MTVAACGEGLRFGAPEVVVDEASNDYVVTSDGGPFLVAGTQEQESLPIQVVVDWAARLEGRE